MAVEKFLYLFLDVRHPLHASLDCYLMSSKSSCSIEVGKGLTHLKYYQCNRVLLPLPPPPFLCHMASGRNI